MDITGNVENAFSISFLRLSIDLSTSNQPSIIDDVIIELFLEDFLMPQNQHKIFLINWIDNSHC